MSPRIPKSPEITTPEKPLTQNSGSLKTEQVQNSVESILSKEAKEKIQ